MHRFAAIVVAGMLIASSAVAATTDNAPLAPGKPAGVQQAALAGNGFLFLTGLVIVAGGIALVATSGNSGNSIATSTTGTP